jgi:enoyl-CoA hydratase/carnithine racemase
MGYETLTVEVAARLSVVTITRPEVRNALSREVLAELRDALGVLRESDEVGLVGFTGAGDKAFVAGADIGQLRQYDLHTGLNGEMQRTFDEIEAFPKPTVAAVNGFALGGGCELALACDLRYAARSAKLGQPEINLGIIPGWGGTQRLARATTLGYAKELIFTGRVIDAEEAERHGLVNAIFEPAELFAKTMEVAALLASKSPVALAAAKEACNRALQGAHGTNLASEADSFGNLFASEDAKEGMTAFVEKREPAFRGR